MSMSDTTKDLKTKIFALKVGEIIEVESHSKRIHAQQIALRAGIKLKTKLNLASGFYQIKRVANQRA
jgi:hypothetical protein